MATVPTVKIWPESQPASGQLLTAADANAQFRDAPTFLLRPPSCKVYRNTTTSRTNGDTTTGITWTGTRWDTDSMWSSGNATRLTFTTAGWYRVSGHVNWLFSSGTGSREVLFRHYNSGGVQQRAYRRRQHGNPVGWHGMGYELFVTAAAGDYLLFCPVQTSGSTQNYGYADLTAIWVGTGVGGAGTQPDPWPIRPFAPGDILSGKNLYDQVSRPLESSIVPTAKTIYGDAMAQSLSTGVMTDVDITAVGWATGTWIWNWGSRGTDFPVTGKWEGVTIPLVPSAGLYLVTAYVEFAGANAGADFEMRLLLYQRRGANDILFAYTPWMGGYTDTVGEGYSVSGLWPLAAEDGLIVKAQHWRGSALNIQRIGLWATRLGESPGEVSVQ